ncbi:MAG: glycerophosphodiester phosphodiesterase [Steroidobacteraceae bacterium]|nr:glycerophosphodiester phosphodiesterase [Steroidobacteraceae bacterium]
MSDRPIVIGHRGASGYVPEHTLAAYFLALQQGADFAEPDLVMTRDGVLVARHENEIGGTTDVAQRPQFASRRTVKVIDGVEREGWFTEDFTLAELKTLRARERIPDVRPANARFDGQFEIPTFDEVLALVRSLNEQRAAAAKQAGRPCPRSLGVYPETKHPSYFDRLGLPMDDPLLQALERHGFAARGAPVFIQSFEVANLRRLRQKTPLPLVQLIEASGAPYDFVAAGDRRTYADLITPAGLAEIASYADAIGPHKGLIIPRDHDDALGTPTSLVRDAHAAGLAVHPWTFRAENHFLPRELRSSGDAAQPGDLAAELRAFLGTGIDGFFTDHPDIGARVLV